MRQFIDLTDQRFGRLIAKRCLGPQRSTSGKSTKTMWHCECDCGGSTIVTMHSLRKGVTQSCGCLHREMMTRRSTHGDTKGRQRTTEHQIWSSMLQRCRTPTCHAYPNYGGRGIRVCDQWLSYANFLADMGRRPSLQHSLDRIDVNGHYEPGNCRWATRKAQRLNTRNTVYIVFRGVRKTAVEWGDALGIPAKTLKSRLRHGWGVEATMTTPINGNRPRIAHSFMPGLLANLG